MTTPGPDVRAALASADLPQRVATLGFDPEDATDLLAAAAAVLGRPGDLAVVEAGAQRLVGSVGVLPPTDGRALWRDLAVDDEGVLALLALLVTAPAVAAFHTARGVPADISAATLADLAQQTRVHRRAYGGLGLGTYAWESGYVWSGALYRLGRLQFDLERRPTVDGTGEEWVLSTHVPRGPGLDPADVEASLAAAPRFFAEHFGDRPARSVHCRSWLLDPRIPELLPGSNLAAFQQRWRTYGTPEPGDEDVRFFVFDGDTAEVSRLAAGTALRRAAIALWSTGQSWHLVEGRLAS